MKCQWTYIITTIDINDESVDLEDDQHLYRPDERTKAKKVAFGSCSRNSDSSVIDHFEEKKLIDMYDYENKIEIMAGGTRNVDM